MTLNDQISDFLNGNVFAVAGASPRRRKYGNKVLRCYLQNDLTAYPVNPNAEIVEGLISHSNLKSIPESVHGVSIITPSEITEQIVEDAIDLGIKHIWIQPGAESQLAIDRAEENGINVIARGACLLVVLGYREEV